MRDVFFMKKFHFMIVLVLLFTACSTEGGNGIEQDVASKPTVQTTEIVLPTPTARPSPTPPFISEEIAPLCVPRSDPGDLETVILHENPEAIQDFLNRGAAPNDLETALLKAGTGGQPLSVAEADLTGDGSNDMAVSVIDPTSSLFPPQGTLIFLVCEEGFYELGSTIVTKPGEGGPLLQFIQDLDGDGASEVVVTIALCETDACAEQLDVYAWNGISFVRMLAEPADPIVSPKISVTDADEDGVFTIQAMSGAGAAVIAKWDLESAQGLWFLAIE
jgi:hypothetical protein